jgi:hypothetical protein
MNTAVCKGLDSRSWKDLYQASLFEADLKKLPERIGEAETAVAKRARELFVSDGDNIEEQESLEYALCNLNALRSSLKREPTAIQRSNDFDYLKRA